MQRCMTWSDMSPGRWTIIKSTGQYMDKSMVKRTAIAESYFKAVF
jgi:hypothetical protein